MHIAYNAVAAGNALMDAGVFGHVVKQHRFKVKKGGRRRSTVFV